ncbi:SDR family NAD(P)-dependent oxidoreductase [Nocardioides sp. GXZ039]|uniref:SDR family NAD(P)-dependent oxidoreductase n=1 Tax=Nocardioides sp. GXZ039 TaxID=3136018 RepID=UPI0030F3E9AD
MSTRPTDLAPNGRPSSHPDRADLFDLTDRVVVVTGASSGLGERFVRVLAGRGARVVAAARRDDALGALADEVGTDSVLPVRTDVTSEDSVRRLHEEALSWQGRVDVLVNNAGATHVRTIAEETPEQFAHLLDVNLVGLYRCARAFGLAMAEQGGGSIINIASALGLRGSRRIPHGGYCASKGGVVNLTHELAGQWARTGVRVNAIAPGYFESEMSQELFATEDGRAYIRRYIPMGRGGAAHELDGALVYLASDASTYVTGSVLSVDGGWTAV